MPRGWPPRGHAGCKTAFDTERRYFAGHAKEAVAVAGKSDTELAAWTMLSRDLLNLDETLTRH